jgi:DedD protein
MEVKNELNDIILNKNSSSAGNKKIILAVATLGIILIVVIMLMSSLTSSKTDNLPQAALPPEPQKEIIAGNNESLFEEVNVIRENNTQENGSLDKIAQKLKEESIKENDKSVSASQPEVQKATAAEPKKIETAKTVTAKETQKESPKTAPVSPAVSASSPTVGGHYIQVGSFEKHQPDDKFLNSILKLGYKYKFHEVKANGRTVSKVLVGPFPSQEDARKALVKVRSSVEPGAFLTKI